jgi:hypothetical protein
MCGIFGWSFKTTSRKLPVIATVLALENESRGEDSWGYYAPLCAKLRKGTGRITRRVKAGELAVHPLLFAHTRHATTGEITRANAHPFVLPSLVGAHNGIVDNHESLNKAHSRKCAVDSEHIFRHLDEGSKLEDIEAWGSIEYAKLAMPDRVYLSRFNGGELTIRQVRGGLVWSSNAAHLSAALRMAGMKSKPYCLDDGSLYFASAGLLYETGITLDFDTPRFTRSLGFSLPDHYSEKKEEIEFDKEWSEWNRRDAYDY